MTILKKIYKNCQKNKMFKKIEKQIVNSYMLGNHHITINNFETWMKDCKKIQQVEIDDIRFEFIDNMASNTIDIVSREMISANVYDFKNIDFKKEDIVIDIGANIGIVSIFLAKKFPFLKIYSFEPVVQNYENFINNIKLNNIPEDTIFPYNLAVTRDGRNVDMSINTHNLGGSSISDVISVGSVQQKCNMNIKSVTLENIFKQNNINQLKLLKIDCEGSEYEILQNCPENILNSIQILRGEFHENKKLTNEYDIDSLINYTKRYIKDIKIEPARECFMM